MGEIADMMINGLMCQCCGVFMDDMEEPGYARYCAACQPPSKSQQKRFTARRANAPSIFKMNCPECGQRVKKVGLKDHMRAVHGVAQ